MSVEFTPEEKRILQFSMDPDTKITSEHVALRNILDSFPWILDVANHRFNKRIAAAILYANAKVIELQRHVDEVIAEEKAKEAKP